jgi:predicted phosphodiesterase
VPQPPIPLKFAKQCVHAVEAALRLGHPPPGVPTSGGQLGAKRVAANAMGTPDTTFSNRLRAAQRVYRAVDWTLWKNPTPEKPALPSVAQLAGENAARQMLVLKDEVSRLRRELDEARRHAVEAEAVERDILGLRDRLQTPPAWAIKPMASSKSPGVPVLVLSDWHYGEVVDEAAMGGVNRYSASLAAARLKRVIERASGLALNHMVNPKYPGIVVCLGGDMVTGRLRAEDRETNDRTREQQVLDGVDLIAAALLALADRFGQVWVAGTFGNHGRDDVKPRLKGRAVENADWLTLRLVARLLAADKRFHFSIPTTPDTAFTVFGWRFMLTHGDLLGVKGGDGIIGALGPIMRGEKKTRDSAAMLGSPFDVLLMGHWHQYLPLGRVIVNGSLVGYNEYARYALRAVPEAPQQALFFVHSDHGVTNQWGVFAEPGAARPYRPSAPVVM